MKGNLSLLLATIHDENPAKPIYGGFGMGLAIGLGCKIKRFDAEDYEGGGWTIIIYLEESHICLESYPESQLVELEVSTCKRITREKFQKVLDWLCEQNGTFYFNLKALQKTQDGWK